MNDTQKEEKKINKKTEFITILKRVGITNTIRIKNVIVYHHNKGNNNKGNSK